MYFVKSDYVCTSVLSRELMVIFCLEVCNVHLVEMFQWWWWYFKCVQLVCSLQEKECFNWCKCTMCILAVL